MIDKQTEMEQGAFERVANVLEEVLKQHITTCELRDYYRKRAGLETKCE